MFPSRNYLLVFVDPLDSRGSLRPKMFLDFAKSAPALDGA